jgi:FtsP/CotA-like multicopper oxidase with cupredoxin domain
VVNQTKMDHPFHLHGFFFQVLQVNGAPPPYGPGRTPSTSPPRAGCASPGCPTTGRAAGCTTATSWSTTPPG